MSSQSSTSQIIKSLLIFQDHFLAIIHRQVYHANIPISEAILKFQITYISDINQKFNKLIDNLSNQLLDKKLGYEGQLRDNFQKLLNVDYLPLLRFSRIQITKLSLFGFDIYIEPLQAVLNIISRMQNLKNRILQDDMMMNNNSIQDAIQGGWDEYIRYSIEYKLLLNIYILRQYLNIGNKSFLRKDRQILFTGINKFYQQLISKLIKRGGKKLLQNIVELNNILYQFHPSFNYFYLYTLLLPLRQEYQYLFAYMKDILNKCIRTNIITPLLFGIIRNRNAFLQFIQQADSIIFLPYINTIISAIAINFKLRILQYQQIMDIFQAATFKAGLLGTIRTQQVLGNLEEGWKDAKQFFISAVKIGFNSGDVQSWKSIEFESIGNRIIGGLINGMLLNIVDNDDNLKRYLENGEQKLDEAVRRLSRGKIDIYLLKSTIYELQQDISSEQDLYLLISIVNLVKITQLYNEYTLNFLISSFNRIIIKIDKIILKNRLKQCIQMINILLLKLSNKNILLIKDKLLLFHNRYNPINNYKQIINLYYNNYEIKKCLINLLSFNIKQQQYQQYIILILNKFISIPNDNKIIIKTFYQQYIIRYDYIHLTYQTHSLISYLISEFTHHHQKSIRILQIIIHICPWLYFAILNFPISLQAQLYSFSTWLVEHHQYHHILALLIKNSRGKILSQNGEDIIEILIIPSILDHISKKINQIDQIQILNKLSNLALNILPSKFNQQFVHQLLLLKFYILEKDVFDSIARLSFIVFKQNLKDWILQLFQRRIEGKSDLMIGHRKRVFKTNNANIYFLGEAIISKEQSGIKYESIDILKRVRQQPKQMNNDENNLKKILRQLQYYKFDVEIDKKQLCIFVQQSKLYSVPVIDIKLIDIIFNERNKELIEFIGLNLQNYDRLIEIGFDLKDIDYIRSQRLNNNIIKYIPKLILLQKQYNIQLLKLMSQNLNIIQKMRLSQNYFIQSQIIPYYCQHSQGIEYLSTFNGNNWRIILDYFTREFININLPSIILQYNEFVGITGQKNDEYQKIIDRYINIIKNFINLFQYKIKIIIQLSNSKEQLHLRSANQFSSLNIILSSLQLKEILQRLSKLNRLLSNKKLGILSQFVQIIMYFNRRINEYYTGQILLPDFINGYYLTNENVLNLKMEIGIMLQRYYQDMRQQINPSYMYYYKNIQSVELGHFMNVSNIDKRLRIQDNQNIQLLKRNYYQLIDNLKKGKVIDINNKKISINYIIKSNIKSIKFYQLGCYHTLLSSQFTFQLTGLLKIIQERKLIPWEIIQRIDNQAYLHIKSVQLDSQIAKRNLTFAYKDELLVGSSEGLRVNQYNKHEYCNKIGLKVLGGQLLSFLRQFMRGCIYQKK